MTANKEPSEPSFEQEETQLSSLLLVYPADGFAEARRCYMDGVPSEEHLGRVLGALTILGGKRGVIEKFGDSRLDFDSIVKGLE